MVIYIHVFVMVSVYVCVCVCAWGEGNSFDNTLPIHLHFRLGRMLITSQVFCDVHVHLLAGLAVLPQSMEVLLGQRWVELVGGARHPTDR